MRQKPSDLTEPAMTSRLWAYYERFPKSLQESLAGLARELAQSGKFPDSVKQDKERVRRILRGFE
jgi:hypothetical protein